MLLLALRQGQGPVDTAGIAARLGMDEAAVTDCLQYWQESGLFTESQNPQPAKETPKARENNKSAVVKTTENGITTIRSRGHLSPGETNAMLRRTSSLRRWPLSWKPRGGVCFPLVSGRFWRIDSVRWS